MKARLAAPTYCALPRPLAAAGQECHCYCLHMLWRMLLITGMGTVAVGLIIGFVPSGPCGSLMVQTPDEQLIGMCSNPFTLVIPIGIVAIAVVLCGIAIYSRRRKSRR